MKRIFGIIIVAGIFALAACGDNSGIISFPVDADKYYKNEIFEDNYRDIYGAWALRAISGGFTGTGFSPDFDFLEVQRIGIFKIVRNDSVLAYGKIQIEEQKGDAVTVAFKPEKTLQPVSIFDSEKLIDLRKDAMNLFSPCCDRYNYHFVRKD